MNTTSLTKSLALLAGLMPGAALLNAGDDKGIPAVMQGKDDPNIGIKYKKNQGLFVTEISARIIGLQMADVEEKPVPGVLQFTAQVYDTAPAGRALATAWVPAATAASLPPGTVVTADGQRRGKVTEVSTFTAAVNQKAEVLLEMEDEGDKLTPGGFLKLSAALPAAGDVVVVPASAVLRTSEGIFAYVDNSGWLVRTPVTLGSAHDGVVEITDGLLSGDVIATRPVMTLWLTELQLTKSGKPCSCGH
jgi:hypothetical protein